METKLTEEQEARERCERIGLERLKEGKCPFCGNLMRSTTEDCTACGAPVENIDKFRISQRGEGNAAMSDTNQPAPARIDFEAATDCAEAVLEGGVLWRGASDNLARAYLARDEEVLALRAQVAERDAEIARMREKERLIDKFVDGFPVEVDF